METVQLGEKRLREKKKMKHCNGSCDSMVPPLLSRRRLIVNGRPLGCRNTPSGPFSCSGRSRDYCQGIRACRKAGTPQPIHGKLASYFHHPKQEERKKNSIWYTWLKKSGGYSSHFRYNIYQSSHPESLLFPSLFSCHWLIFK